MAEPVDLKEFVAGFVVEAHEHLAVVGDALQQIEAAEQRGEPAPRAVRQLFRALHTIKGLAGMVGADAIADIAHHMESVLRAAERTGGRLPADAIAPLSAAARAVQQRVGALSERRPLSPPPNELLDALDRIVVVASAPDRGAGEALKLPPELLDRLNESERAQLLAGSTAPKRALRLDFAPNPERAARGVTIGTVRDRLTPIAEIVKVVPLSVPPDEQAPAGLKFSILAVTEAPDSELQAATEIEAESIIEICEAAPAPASLFPDSMDDDASPGSRAVVRVGIERLDEALRRLSDLIVTRFRLERSLAALARSGADVRELRQVVDDNARQLRDMRAAILKLRLVAANEMLEPLGLIVRGQRASAGKNVELELDAGQAELDKAVADRVLPVLVHLVRNAIDHGLEMPEERVRAGKSPQGKLRIRCTEYSGTRLVITVADDGRGIDIERLAQRAGRPLPQSPAELISLLSVPGLSARDEATSTSGRGMGIDIVRRTVVDELSGELEVATAQGSGTMFTLRIPLTLLIVDAFTFECSNRAFVVPVAMVDEIIEVAPDSIVQGPAALGNAARSRVLSRRGRAIPVVPLGDLLSLPKSAIEQRKALIVRAADSAIAFEIDRVIGQQEVVIRPMDDPLIRTRGVSGSTDLGDGKPTLVLDLMLLKKTLEPLRDAQTGVLT